jgi:hypothetical protein
MAKIASEVQRLARAKDRRGVINLLENHHFLPSESAALEYEVMEGLNAEEHKWAETHLGPICERLHALSTMGYLGDKLSQAGFTPGVDFSFNGSVVYMKPTTFNWYSNNIPMDEQSCITLGMFAPEIPLGWERINQYLRIDFKTRLQKVIAYRAERMEAAKFAYYLQCIRHGCTRALGVDVDTLLRGVVGGKRYDILVDFDTPNTKNTTWAEDIIRAGGLSIKPGIDKLTPQQRALFNYLWRGHG